MVTFQKLITALLGAVIICIQTIVSDDTWTDYEKIECAALLLAAFGTWLMPNTPLLRTAKTWVNGLLAGLAVLATFLGGGLTGSEWLTAVVAVLTTAGVYVTPAPLIAVQRGDLPTSRAP